MKLSQQPVPTETFKNITHNFFIKFILSNYNYLLFINKYLVTTKPCIEVIITLTKVLDKNSLRTKRWYSNAI